MSVQLHPAIKELDTESLCYGVYSQLYHNFFNAQDKKDDEHPWGITEGDDTSVRLRNTAYGFAEAIAGAASGEATGGISGTLLDYLKKTGGNMTGKLTAGYGFEAGVSNSRILETFRKETAGGQGQISGVTYGIRITGDLEVGAENLFIGGKRFIYYDGKTDTVLIENPDISFSDSVLRSKGGFIFGEDRETGVYISPSAVLVKGKEVYHKGNANLEGISWKMLDALVSGNLAVKGKTDLDGVLNACRGVKLGTGGSVVLNIDETGVVCLNNYLSFASSFGIKIGNIPVLTRINSGDIRLGAAGGDLLLGSEYTAKTRLLANISDIDGDYVLLSKYGAAYFPDSLTVRHHYGDNLLASYRADSDDEGIVIHKRLRFGTSNGAWFEGKENGIGFHSFAEHVTPGNRTVLHYETQFGYGISTSRYQPQNRISGSLFISTDADFITFDKPVESKSHIGIDNSLTRITDGALYFSNENYLLSISGGIKHYGNAYFLNSLASERFSSGFAGSGWAIIQNKTTGNIAATFDELTVRKKMRIYELEVQKISAANGSLWISDNCSGDTVEKL